VTTIDSEVGPRRPLHLLLMDANTLCVRALFAAMPPEVTISAFVPRGLAAAVRQPLSLARDWQWREICPRWWEQAVVVPSWSRVPGLTAAVCGLHLGRRSGVADTVIVYTLPYYARLACRWPGVPRVYFAYDPYGCYNGWDQAVVAAGERKMLTHCDAAFAISPALADDFRRLTDRPVFVQPNGVSESFLAMFDGPLPPPDDLPPHGPPIVGCVGQISRTYDWEMLAELVGLCPELRFVFVGPRFEEGPAEQERMDRVFRAANVSWLGPKPHADLPRYIRRFDVCLSPLRIEPCNDRRSLLRLYDYLASDRPIVSTAIASALEHKPHIEIGRDAGEMAVLLRRLSTASSVDRAARRAYIVKHTWTRRAELFLNRLRTIPACRGA
jgi:glycosyltransferase involved in cell wall biosynthesis